MFLYVIWSRRLLSSASRWLSSRFGRRRSRMSRTWFTSAERSRSCHPSATHTSFLYMKVRVPCARLTWAHINKKHACPKLTPPSAHSALVEERQDFRDMTCRCHNKTWTTALGCYSSSLLRLAAWASKSLDGFDSVHLDLSECARACVCVRMCMCWTFVCVRAVVF